jgi:hypothetical protein
MQCNVYVYIDGSHYAASKHVFQFDDVDAGRRGIDFDLPFIAKLGAMYGPLILHTVLASVHHRSLTGQLLEFKLCSYWKVKWERQELKSQSH